MVGGVPGPIVVLAAGAFRKRAYECLATVSHAPGFSSVQSLLSQLLFFPLSTPTTSIAEVSDYE